MELKVLCDCGQKFKFDVEPVNGRMPFAINCPVCNEDATAKANQLISENLAATNPTNAAAPPPIAPVAPAVGGLRIARSAPAPLPAMAVTPESAAEAAAPTPGAIRPIAPAAAATPPKIPSFGRGLLGGFVGALVGSIIYLLIFKYTGVHLKLLAIGVGGLAGWMAEILGKGEGSKELGVITAVFVLAGIVGAQYLVALGWWDKVKQDEVVAVQSAYSNAVVEAAAAVKMVPTGSDAEIRAYLAKQSASAGVTLSAADFQPEDVKDFRGNQLPELQRLASGNLTKAEYDQTHDLKSSGSVTDSSTDNDEGTFKGVFLLLFLTKSNIFALVAAAGLAFKLSTNA